MRLEELPPKLRRAAINAIARDELARLPKRPSVSRRAVARPAGGRWTCVRCRAVFGAYAAAERHVDDAHGAGRIEWGEA
jgi:ribosomal protein L37AE/L43A